MSDQPSVVIALLVLSAAFGAGALVATVAIVIAGMMAGKCFTF